MTEQQHPITPPPELVQQLRNAAPPLGLNREKWIATQAARWGADQELEACCKLLDGCTVIPVDGYASTAQNRLTAVDRVARLRAARRPKPPSLKEQALALLDKNKTRFAVAEEDVIRLALESLPD